uniref:Uncharacterized protein n=1 Tax=Clastoptera arizonana TaxID=38151 RepID=A0A1B6DCU1_9HEMI
MKAKIILNTYFTISVFCHNLVEPFDLNDTTNPDNRIFGIDHIEELNNNILEFYSKRNKCQSFNFFSNLRSYIFELYLYIQLIEDGDEKITHKAFMMKTTGGPEFFKIATERQNFPREMGWDKSETELYTNLIIDVEQAWNSLSRMLDVLC